LLEESIKGDFALIKAWKGDAYGNLVMRKTARNFNADMAGAAQVTVAEVEEIVPVGELDGSAIHVPGILVNRVVKGNKII
jgi:acyl CoA:acetate/3-ketoacid CoA transferase alpha subunit